MKKTVLILIPFIGLLTLSAIMIMSIFDKDENTGKMEKLTIQRQFEATPEKIFAAFAKPENMNAWWTDDTEFDVDLRVGGNYAIARNKNGVIHRMTGEYLEIEQPNKLKFTCAMLDFSPIVDTISIEILPNGKAGSKMIFTQMGEGIDAELKDLPKGVISESEKGWRLGFDLIEAANNGVKKGGTENGENQKIATSLTFQDGNAEKAMNFYIQLFDNSKLIDVRRWGENGSGKEGSIMKAVFELDGKRFVCSDSPPVHNWDFTPAVSIYVECENQEEMERLFSKLSENGQVAMPMGNYGFSQKFAWLVDQFGVSWQLNLQ